MTEKSEFQLDTEKLAGRVALLNSENERLKKIIVKYEKKLSEELGKNAANSSSVDRDRELEKYKELCRQRLSEVEYWKRECSEAKNKKDSTEDLPFQIDYLQSEIEHLKGENKGLAEELEKLKRGSHHAHSRENQSFSASSENEKVVKECNRVIRNLKIEVDEWKARVEVLEREKEETVSKEYHFEKLKEQEVQLLENLSISQHLAPNVGQLQSDLAVLATENEKLVRALRELNQREKERRETIEGLAVSKFESEARRRMEHLEHKINELIDENENILRENEQLKYSSSNVASKDRRVSGNRTGRSKDKEELEDMVKSLEMRLANKEVEVGAQREFFEQKVQRLEKEIVGGKRKGDGGGNSGGESNYSSNNMKATLEDAYNLISKLEKENHMLIDRLDWHESAHKRSLNDTGNHFSASDRGKQLFKKSELVQDRYQDYVETGNSIKKPHNYN